MKKVVALVLGLVSMSAFGQETTGYQRPNATIEAIALAPPTPAVSFDATGQRMLILERSAMPTIEELSQPELRLAGVRINPAANGPSRENFIIGFKLKRVQAGAETAVKGLPANLKASSIQWSPDDSKIAFCQNTTSKIELWVIDVASATAKKVSELALNGTLGSPYEWVDNQTLVAKTLAPNRGKAPERLTVPSGPTIQQNLGKQAGAPTFQDLLKNTHDEALFEHYFSSTLSLLPLTGAAKTLAPSAIYLSFEPSPNGQYILIQTIHKPFSYVVPLTNFPRKIEVLDKTGKSLKTLTSLPLFDSQDWNRDAVKTGQRSHAWRADRPATVYWVEAQDEGNPKNKVAVRDRVFMLPEPFTAQPVAFYDSQNRFGGFSWGDDRTALANEYWYTTRRTLTKIINPAGGSEPVVLFDRSSEDRYNNPGSPETRKNAFGREVLAISDNQLIMKGMGASPEGDRPFVDLLNLTTKATERLWRSEAPYYEVPVKMLNLANRTLITSRQSQEEQPNYFIRDARQKNALTQITSFPNPYPMLKGVQKQLLKYKRPDGVDLSATLYLPAGYKKEDGPLPTFLWAYPAEFKTREAASQVSGSPHTFTRVSSGSPIYWATQGYAVLDNAAIPIVGEGDKEPNDTYVEQLVASAKAAIDEGVKLGVVDATRVGVGGHSYGAFMTANLLTHSNLFRAGIARSGAYNRTLTPFGFQNEKRTYWEAASVYNEMSPFMNAHKMKHPLLLIHGEADNNTGTFPLQSDRYYNALKGMGATTRFVLLPNESHGYAAKESVLHMLWEMDNWLNTYVKPVKK